MIWTDVALRLGVAVVIGAVIGLDRELRHKSAGVRTIGLVTLGAALAVMTVGADMAAASRVLQGTLAGIGFLGAGVIMRRGREIEGLTTAASIWTAAALGAACGLGAWQPVAIGSALVLVLLVVAGGIEKRLSKARVNE
jgi:putative Mg2+ transporter-C (MgtC) family protein